MGRALQTQQTCDQLASCAAYDEMVAFLPSPGDVVTVRAGFVGNAAGYAYVD